MERIHFEFPYLITGVFVRKIIRTQFILRVRPLRVLEQRALFFKKRKRNAGNRAERCIELMFSFFGPFCGKI